MKYAFAIPVLVIAVFLLTNLYIPLIFKGKMIFIVDTILWATIIPTTLLISKITQTNIWRTDKTLIQIAALIAIFQISLAVFTAFFMGFGKNLNVWTLSTLTIYFPFLFAPFLAIEFSRALLAQIMIKRKPTIAILLISLFYTFIASTIPRYLALTTPLAVTEFLIRTFIPTLAISLLATYLAYLGGLPANLTYMTLPTLFTWFSPILPNIQWQTQSILTVIAGTIGFLILDQAVKPLPTPHERFHLKLKKGKGQLPYWTVIALIGLITIWSSTGMLGFTPTIIASESMQPTLNPGDVTIVLSTPPQTIKIGDIIQYKTAEEPIIHRVIDKYEASDSIWFITQGDANNVPDNPVSEHQVIGKVIFVIPKLGWISIYLKEVTTQTYVLLTVTVPKILMNASEIFVTNGIYITTILALAAYSCLLVAYKAIQRRKSI